MVKEICSGFYYYFKKVDEAHQNIVETLVEFENVYVNQESITTFELPIVWAQSSRYLNREDNETIAALSAIKNNTKIDLVHAAPDYNEHLFNNEEVSSLEIDKDVWHRTQKLQHFALQNYNIINHYYQNSLRRMDKVLKLIYGLCYQVN